MSKKYPNERDSVMVSPGSFTEERVVSRIREHVPNRFIIDPETDQRAVEVDELVDLTGYIHLEGKRTPVMTGYWGGVEIWQLDTDAPDWPTCPTCGEKLDIGSAQTWQCWPCFYKALPTVGTGYKAHPMGEGE